MNEFDILDLLDNNDYKLLVVFKTPEPPLQYLDEVSKVLVNKRIKGFILIDELIHSGNNEDRFIKVYFDGENFDRKSFSFEVVDRRSEIRKYSCEVLRKEPDVIDYSTLNNFQKKLILSGLFI